MYANTQLAWRTQNLPTVDQLVKEALGSVHAFTDENYYTSLMAAMTKHGIFSPQVYSACTKKLEELFGRGAEASKAPASAKATVKTVQGHASHTAQALAEIEARAPVFGICEGLN